MYLNLQPAYSAYLAQPVAPVYWGEQLPGVKTRLATHEPVVALTFDACGSANDGYNEGLINFLREQRIPATLFLSGKWIDKFPQKALELARDPLFEIENHGATHRPASTAGYSVYGITGTQSAQDLIYEIGSNAQKIQSYTGIAPRFYRPGTAYWDSNAVNVARSGGYEPVGFSVLGDKGATYSPAEVAQAVGNAQPGSIVIMHMNHPEKNTLDGLKQAVFQLRQRGFRFAKLADYPLV